MISSMRNTLIVTMCSSIFEEVYPHGSDMLEQAIPQRMNENVLLTWDSSNGRFADEPVARFGLGEYGRIDRFEIAWSTGRTTVIPGPFEAGHLYSLQRLTQDRQ